jgi:hypothetical protein
VEQSNERPYRQSDGRSKRTCELTSSIVPRGTSFHRSVELGFPSIGTDASTCHVFDVARARGLHQHRGSGAADTDHLVPWKASPRSSGVARIAESQQAATPPHRWPIGVKILHPDLRDSVLVHGKLTECSAPTSDRPGAGGGRVQESNAASCRRARIRPDCCCAVRWEPRLCPSDANRIQCS